MFAQAAPGLTRNGTLGRVYGGDPTLVHVPDGKRGELGIALAQDLDHLMRVGAENRTPHERATQKLCPGCYMIVMFNALVHLARQNGQPLDELARTMQEAFARLLETENAINELLEEIAIIVDPEGVAYV